MSERHDHKRRWLWKLAFRNARPYPREANMTLVLFELWEWADKNGCDTSVSIKKLAHRVGLTRRTTGKYLKQAEAEGWIARRLIQRPGKPAHYETLLTFPLSVRVLQWLTECLEVPAAFQFDLEYVEAWRAFEEAPTLWSKEYWTNGLEARSRWLLDPIGRRGAGDRGSSFPVSNT